MFFIIGSQITYLFLQPLFLIHTNQFIIILKTSLKHIFLQNLQHASDESWLEFIIQFKQAMYF